TPPAPASTPLSLHDALPIYHRRPVRYVALPGAGHRPADRDVPVPGAHRPVAAQDRPAVRPGPHHGDARRPEDPLADGGAPVHLQPGHRAHEPDQTGVPERVTEVLRHPFSTAFAPILWKTGGQPCG